jgi:ribosomal protein RSM22 (predicted rRNA methylase)
VVEERAEAAGFTELKRAAAEMSERYREGRAMADLPAELRAAAYLVARMPATYAAAHMVLGEVRARIGSVAGILDVGAGAGAASLAAREFFPEASITMLERDAEMAGIARVLLPGAALIRDDITRMGELPPHDLVIAAYSLGEFGRAGAARLWEAARAAFVAIEPGTPRGFALIRAVRDELLASGAHMAAPCPAAAPCPITGDDWCHFAARVERTSLHRRIKGGELGYEDEKFSYVALARVPVATAAARIIRRPRQQPGVVLLDTCAPAGLGAVRIAKRDRDRFRAARHAAWGDEWP